MAGRVVHDRILNRPSALNRLLRQTLDDVRPRSLLVLGGSTGNGLEHVNPEVTERVTVVDVNASYLRRLADQFSNPGFALEIRCADLKVRRTREHVILRWSVSPFDLLVGLATVAYRRCGDRRFCQQVESMDC